MELVSLTTKNFQDVVELATRALQKGAVIVAPTDTVYGLAAVATNEAAVRRLYRIKARDPKKPLPIFVKNFAMAKNVAVISAVNMDFLEKSWPGKTTAVLPRKADFKIFGVEEATVALRIPDYHFMNSLLEALNLPLTGTSANISGDPASTKIDDVIGQFEGAEFAPDIVVNAGDLRDSNPSSIVYLSGKKPRILRP